MAENILEVQNLVKHFKTKRGMLHAVDGVSTRIMDSTSFSGMVGLQAEKGSLALGLNYGVQASRHETDPRVNMGVSWKF